MRRYINDIIEYLEWFYPYGCTIGEILNYINAKNTTQYTYRNLYNFLNYHSTNNVRFEKIKTSYGIYFRLKQ